jgi:hypothetical protein
MVDAALTASTSNALWFKAGHVASALNKIPREDGKSGVTRIFRRAAFADRLHVGGLKALPQG